MCLVIALVAVVFLVSDLLFPGVVAVTVTMAVFLLALTLWLALPVLRRIR